MGGRIDTDVHLTIPTGDLAPYLDEPWRWQALARSRSRRPGDAVPSELPRGFLATDIGDLTNGGRIQRPVPAHRGFPADPIGADYRIVFPEQLLGLGLHPTVALDGAMAFAYARWLTEAYLPAHPRDRGMLYLPIRQPGVCVRLVRQFAACPGVAGVFVTTAGNIPIYANRYMDLYAEMDARRLVLAFHPTSVWLEKPFEAFDQYLDVWAIGIPFSMSVYLANWILHGLPERFPNIRCVFCESGLTWPFFIGHRLDRKYMERPSEAPLLRRLPTEYLTDCYFTSHPREYVRDVGNLEASVRLFGPTRILYASNFPRWDFDTPQAVEDLLFLSPEERQDIVGRNAARLFGLPVPAGATRV